MAAGVTESKPRDSSPTAHEIQADPAASNEVQEEPARAVAVEIAAGQPQQQEGLGEPVMLGAASSRAADQDDSTTTASVTSSKRSGKRRKGHKRRERMQRGSKADEGAKVQLPGALQEFTAGTEAHDGFLAASAAPSSSLKESSEEGATNKQQHKRPEGAVPESAAAGATDGGQGQVQQVPSEPVPAGEAPGDLSASRADLPLTVTTVRCSETDAVRSPDPSTWRKPKRALTNSDITITSVCVGTCLLFGSLVVFLVMISNQKVVIQQFCHTEDCDRHAVLLTKNLDWKLDPCEDYAAFVCSAWEPSKAHRDLARSAVDDLRFSWYDLFTDTLARGSLTLPAGKKPLAMYEACTRDYPKNASQMTWIRGMLEKYGLYWPEKPAKQMSPLAMFVALSYKWQWSFWITVDVLQSSSSGKRRVFVRPGLYLPILRNHHRAVKQSYIKYWEQFRLLFYPDGGSDRPQGNEALINEIRIMEENIIETLYELSMSPKKRPALFLFKDIASHVPNASAAEWVRNFQSGLSLEPSLNIDDEIIVSDVSLLEALANFMTKYGTLLLNKHISWLVVQYSSIPADYSILVGYYGSQEKAELLLPVYCAHHVEASFKVLLLGLAYFARFTDRDRQTINTGFNGLISAAVEKVQNAHWIDDESKASVADKLMAVKNALWPPAALLKGGELEKIYAGFPETQPSFAHYWVTTRQAAIAINRTREYEEAMLLLGNNFPEYADYDYVSNAAKMSLGVATPPAYYSGGTKSMLYGGLFFLMAMQLVKALDSEGITWTANGTAVDGTILSNSTLAAYLAREQCHQGGENTSVFPEVPALEVTYSALAASRLQWHSDNLALAKKLPAEHVFFMTLCFLSCASPGARNPSAADCNKIVRNSELFAHVYKCAKGSKMNPEKKCSFFS
ncbi:hypothetical protein V5799_034034 [Amblyomma americanum]|uniref:Peptidase M13 N-terminal domain-containing protein n=1 Tax=Amblyomma americanum TaxID=6943 RepID=A0AAQ4DLL7_AMBAM